jgi:nicotinate-nucleotide--dimethylbenzimidazole phosphoribosyltransferase
VTLFPPDELGRLVALPDGVVPLGWLCVGWPDERPPDPGLERAGWSTRQPLAEVVVHERWPEGDGSEPAAPRSRLAGPGPDRVVGARDGADVLLSPPSSLGVLDRAVDRLVALGAAHVEGGTLVLVGGRHGVADLGVSVYPASLTDEVLAAARAGEAMGAVAASAAGLEVVVVDAGSATGNLRDTDALDASAVAQLVTDGEACGRAAAASGLVGLGEVGVGNTTVAAALAAGLLGLAADDVVGLGAGGDSGTVDRKRAVVAGALERVDGGRELDAFGLLGALGGPELAFLTGVVLGAVGAGVPVVLDGLATSVAALVASRLEPAVALHLVAGQQSRERAHALVLTELGLEPLLSLRLRAGEGVGACLAAGLLLDGLRIRTTTARTE